MLGEVRVDLQDVSVLFRVQGIEDVVVERDLEHVLE